MTDFIKPKLRTPAERDAELHKLMVDNFDKEDIFETFNGPTAKAIWSLLDEEAVLDPGSADEQIDRLELCIKHLMTAIEELIEDGGGATTAQLKRLLEIAETSHVRPTPNDQELTRLRETIKKVNANLTGCEDMLAIKGLDCTVSLLACASDLREALGSFALTPQHGDQSKVIFLIDGEKGGK